MNLEAVQGFASAFVVVVGLGVFGFSEDLDAFDSVCLLGVAVYGYEYAA